jgi:hypothetical protein
MADPIDTAWCPECGIDSGDILRLRDEIDRLRAVTTDTNDAAWREVAIALASELADTGIDPRSYALLAYNHARNGRMDEAVEAARTAYSKDGEHG